jgi:hypothetical protein
LIRKNLQNVQDPSRKKSINVFESRNRQLLENAHS